MAGHPGEVQTAPARDAVSEGPPSGYSEIRRDPGPLPRRPPRGEARRRRRLPRAARPAGRPHRAGDGTGRAVPFPPAGLAPALGVPGHRRGRGRPLARPGPRPAALLRRGRHGRPPSVLLGGHVRVLGARVLEQPAGAGRAVRLERPRRHADRGAVLAGAGRPLHDHAGQAALQADRGGQRAGRGRGRRHGPRGERALRRRHAGPGRGPALRGDGRGRLLSAARSHPLGKGPHRGGGAWLHTPVGGAAARAPVRPPPGRPGAGLHRRPDPGRLRVQEPGGPEHRPGRPARVLRERVHGPEHTGPGGPVRADRLAAAGGRAAPGAVAPSRAHGAGRGRRRAGRGA